MTPNQLLDVALTLNTSDRLWLLDAIRASVPPENWPPPSQAWQEEINRRSEALDAGAMSCATPDEARQRARRKAGLDG